MEHWEHQFNRVQAPDSTVPSHRDGLRKQLDSRKIPGGHGRRTVATLSITALMACCGLAFVFPGWANDIVNNFLVKTITLRTKDGANVTIRKVQLNNGNNAPCDSTCRLVVVRATAEGLKLADPSEQAIVISSTNNDQTWIINGDTLHANSMTTSVGDTADLNLEPCGKFLNAMGAKKGAPMETPKDFEHLQNYPNPFNPTTNISFDLKQSGAVTLKVFNITGQEVATLVNGNLSAGQHTVPFDGSHLTSGAYLYTLRTEGSVMSKMMFLAK